MLDDVRPNGAPATAAAPATNGPASQRGTEDGARLVGGPIAPTLILFSLPILGSNVLQSLNASINTAWIGRLLGRQALSASANANAVLFFLISVTFGLGIAASILVGQDLGRGDLPQARRVVGTSCVFFFGVSIVLSVIGFLGANAVLNAMQTPPDALGLASSYLKIIFLAIPAIFLFTFLMMALRGAGDSRTPFCFLLITAGLDVALNPLLIHGYGFIPRLGIAGSALASLIAQWLGLILLVTWLYLRRNMLCFGPGTWGALRIDPVILRSLLVKGVPMGLQVIVVSSSFILLISFMNHYGSAAVAAFGACFQLFGYIQMPSFALGSAVSSMAAQNVGAGRWDRVDRVAFWGCAFTVLLTTAAVVAVSLADKVAFGLFLGDDNAAIAMARHIHNIVSWSFILFGVAFVLSSTVRATGAVIPPLVILILALYGVRLPAAAMARQYGIDAIFWSFPAGSAAALVLTLLYYRYGRWRQAHMIVA